MQCDSRGHMTYQNLIFIAHMKTNKVRDDPKLLGNNGEIPIFKQSDWWFDSRCEIFSLLDGINQLSR
jgi:hypothetical protein